MRIVEKSSAKKKQCGWKKKEFQSEGKYILCMLPIFPETTTLVFKANPRNPDANLNDMIFVKDKHQGFMFLSEIHKNSMTKNNSLV